MSSISHLSIYVPSDVTQLFLNVGLRSMMILIFCFCFSFFFKVVFVELWLHFEIAEQVNALKSYMYTY